MTFTALFIRRCTASLLHLAEECDRWRSHGCTLAADKARNCLIEAAINGYIAKQAKDGVFTLKDDKTGEQRTLNFVEIHRPM